MARKTVLDLRKMKAGNPTRGIPPQKIVMVTAYDATMARLIDAAGVDMVLVGDSVGMVVQGLDNTLAVTLEDMIYHGRCVNRGLTNAHLTVDLPFMSYQLSPQQALESAGRLVKEAGAQSVKLEGGQRSAAAVRLITEAGIPVVGHVGLTPQSVNALGGYRVQGKSDAAAERLIQDAIAIAEAGAFAVVLEMVPEDVAAEITRRLDVPTIGIGAGVHCDGQVLVCNDLLGLDSRFKPRFVKRFAELEEPMIAAVRDFANEVRAGTFPAPEHSFRRRALSQTACGEAKVTRLY